MGGVVDNQLETLLLNQQVQAQSILEALRRDRQQEQLELLKFVEVRRMLGISRATLWRMMSRGQIKVIEVIPGIKRVPIAEIRRIAEGNGGAVEHA
jgi:predicted DNA-binding protein (UPF0251 family)